MKLKTLISLIVSSIFMYFALSNVDFAEFAASLKECNYLYLIPGVLITWFSQVIRSARWYYLLRPIKRIRFSSLFSATMIGFMANNIFPVRAGEFIRAKMIGEDEGISKTSAFATIVIERVFDGMSILLLLVVTFFAANLSQKLSPEVATNLTNAAYAVLALYMVMIFFILFIIYRHDKAEKVITFLLKPFPDSVTSYVNKILESFREGLILEKGFKNLFIITLLSIIMWGIGAFPLYILLYGFGHPLPLEASYVTLVMIFFATIIPAAPSNVGTFHVGVKYALTFYGLSGAISASIAVVFHMIIFLSNVVMGFLILWLKKVPIMRIKKNGAESEIS